MCILVGIIFAFQIPSVVKSPCDQYGKKGGRTAPTAGAVGKFSEAVQGYLGYTILYTFSWLKSISLLLINPMVKFIVPYIYWWILDIGRENTFPLLLQVGLYSTHLFKKFEPLYTNQINT